MEGGLSEKTVMSFKLQERWRRVRKRRPKLYREIAHDVRQLSLEEAVHFGRWWFETMQGFTPNAKGFVIVTRAIMERWPRTAPDIDEAIDLLRRIRHALSCRATICEHNRERQALLDCERFTIQTLLRVQPW